MRVLVNTSPLIALQRIGRLDLLCKLYTRVVCPQAVMDELQAGRSLFPATAALFDANWIVREPNPPEMELRKELGAGETAVIALAHKTKADLVILDDLQARLVAQGLGLKITGTIGVLLAARQLGHEPDLTKVLADLKAAGFYISDELIVRLTAI